MHIREYNTLAYLDQGSFVGLRALGRGPVVQYVWIYERDVDLDGLRRFHRNLGHTLLGRLIERSPLPFGRHRWVSDDGPTDLDVSVALRRRDQVWDWVDERALLAVDPELGPAWHLGVQPFADGGAAVSLVVSHTTADATAGFLSIVDAVTGVQRDFGFPPAGSRSIGRALREDIAVSARSAREIPAAVAESVRVAREQKNDVTSVARAAPPMRGPASAQPVVISRVYGSVDIPQWDERAGALGGTRNVLFAALAARIGCRLGRIDQDGRVTLSIPVSERVEGDTRANPLNSITVEVDPDRLADDLTGLRAAMKAELVALGQRRDTALAPTALVPFGPQVLARRLENFILKVGKPVGCSNVGEVPEAANRPDGTDADFFWMRGGEAGHTTASLQRLGGHLLVSAAVLRGKLWFAVASWEAEGANTRAAIAEVVLGALGDLGLSGRLE
jgi:diacylglycerol O-acyltransferase / wax synthase